MEVSILIAFGAGLVSFLSPCVVPLIPAYIGYITSSSVQEIQCGSRSIVFSRALGFVIGFSIVFMVMGASASFIGRLFYENRVLFFRGGGILIILFGLHITGLLRVPLLLKEIRVRGPKKAVSWVGSVLMGMAFAAGWTPCVGAVLSTILIYAATAETAFTGIILLFFFSMGLGVPFLITALGINKFTGLLKGIKAVTPYISVTSGILVVIFGLLMFFNRIHWIGNFLGV